ncbi:hypothetical protein [Tautonia sociabilis]|uniref:Uncharacterized protein n=1 Tax=Tautonia sociabilis TaxID=2080755 RepID=A0A432MKP9_9BACT|nr:hypothetical protein [Tautonia sociabilis]RUL88003.1 hypothetical protein TsocGM_09790 [Tautonia sociabilis]
MNLRERFMNLITKFLYGSLALKAQEEAQALHADAVRAAAEGLRSTMAAMEEAEQYLKGDDVDPARREIVSTFRVGVMLMSEQVTDMLRTPLSDDEVRKERLNAPFDRSTNSENGSAAAGGTLPVPGQGRGRGEGNNLSLPPPGRPDQAQTNGSSPPSAPPSSENAEPPKRRRGRPPGTGKRQREARERAAREAMEQQSRTAQQGDTNGS